MPPPSTCSSKRQKFEGERSEKMDDTAENLDSNSDAPASCNDSLSCVSGRSASETLAALNLNHDGLIKDVLSLDNPRLPPSVADFLSEMVKCSNGVGVVSRSLKDEIDKQFQVDRTFSVFMDCSRSRPSWASPWRRRLA